MNKISMYKLLDELKDDAEFMDAVEHKKGESVIELADKIMDAISESTLTTHDILGVLGLVNFNMFKMMDVQGQEYLDKLQ